MTDSYNVNRYGLKSGWQADLHRVMILVGGGYKQEVLVGTGLYISEPVRYRGSSFFVQRTNTINEKEREGQRQRQQHHRRLSRRSVSIELQMLHAFIDNEA